MGDENGEVVPDQQSEATSETTVNNTTTENTEYIRDLILDKEEMKKMFVGGITTDSTDEELKTFFEQVANGKVSDHVIIKKDTDKKSHFGFITFETSEMVDEVLLRRKDLNFKGRLLDVNRAVPKDNQSPGAHEKTKKLFIANLPKNNCSEDDIRKYFECRHPKKFGVIESVQLIKKKDEQGNKLEENKGYGFIMVSSEDMADKMAIQHATFEFGGRRIELKKSVPTNEIGGGKRGAGYAARGAYGAAYSPYSYGGYGGWDGYGYGPGYGGAYDYGYGYGGGYAAPQPQRGSRGGVRGGRYAPY
ncbi:heterogeneous nuclear ribonucleoprotein A0 [Hydra vulgaris]|uniref:Heterogeneous nuclear ribonucleoprotein A0 n=1 Tax=Hydra vulgaris TaxID=6087 RepID=A0ABM4B6G7_HYDVU